MGEFTTGFSSVTRLGVDLAKTVFQVHGVDAKGQVVLARKLRRGAFLAFFARLGPCAMAMEARSSAHHRARQLMALGREVKLIGPADVAHKAGSLPSGLTRGRAQQERRSRRGWASREAA